MELYSYQRNTAKPIHEYESFNAAITHLTRGQNETTVVCVRVDGDGTLGRHAAANDQMMLIISGRGMVSGGDDVFTTVAPGQAVFWRAGELHETRSDSGLTAIVIEGEGIQPSVDMVQLVGQTF